MPNLRLRDRERFVGSIVGMGLFGMMFLIIMTTSMPLPESTKHLEWLYRVLVNSLLFVLSIGGFAVSIQAWKRIRLTGEWIFYNIGFYGFVLFGTQLLSIVLMTRFFSHRVNVFGGAIYVVTIFAGLVISCIIWLVEYLRPEKQA